MKAGRDLLKSVWECTELKASPWKVLHPSDTEDEPNVGLSNEDEAEGMEATPGVARRGPGRPAAPEPQPALAPAPLPVTADEIVMKKRVLKRMKQQVSALLRGEDLLKGPKGERLQRFRMRFLWCQGAKQHAQFVRRISNRTTG